MPTVLAGQNFDLQEPPESIVINLLKYRWNEQKDGLIPAKSDISFSTLGFSGIKSYQISAEPSSAPFITYMSTPPNQYIMFNDPVMIHVWIVKNTDKVPIQLHHITQKIEQIIYENVNNIGWGISSVRMMAPFSSIEVREYFSQEEGMRTSFQNQVESSLWHSQAIIELIYFKVITEPKNTTRVFKTHKYDITTT